MDSMEEVLFSHQDETYRRMQQRLIPNIAPETIIGVRTPVLRQLAKQYDATLPYITQHRLEKWTHNKTIQKAVESYRVLPEHKEILIRYRRKE